MSQTAQDDAEAFAARITLLVKRFGSRTALADASGVDRKTIYAYLEGKRSRSVSIVNKLAAAANVDASWLMTGLGNPDTTRDPDGRDTPFTRLAGAALDKGRQWGPEEEQSFARSLRKAGEVQPVNVPIAAMMADTPVPVLGCAAGSVAGALAISGQAIDYLLRPPALATVSDAYALFVVNSSMVDRYRPGDPIFVHPHQKVKPGDVVIIQVQNFEGGDILSYIKEYIGRDDRDLIALQYNPRSEIRFANRTIKSVHRVMQQRELFAL